MKIFKRIIIRIFILLVIVYLAVSLFIWLKGSEILSKSLSQAIGKEVSVKSLCLTPPYSISINDLRIKDFLAINKITIEPSITGLFFGRVGLNKLTIVKPEVLIIRTEERRFNINDIIDSLGLKQPRKESKKTKNIFFVKEATIKDGKISFQDKVTQLSFDIMPINISSITSLLDFKTRINLDALILSNKSQNLGNISAEGWLNLFKKDMDAELSLKDVEIVYFAPYFKKFFRKAESGKLIFIADLISQHNDLTIDCHLETRDLRFSEESLIVDSENKQITLFSNLSGIVLDTLIGPASGGGMFDFSIHTKFDRPRLEGLQFKGNIFKEPIKNIFKRGPQESIEVIKKVGKDFETLGKELKEQFKGMKDIFKDLKPEVSDEEIRTETLESQQVNTTL